MSVQQVLGAPSPSMDEVQRTVCEDCGRVWIMECENKEINLCYDNENLEEISKPDFLLTIFKEEIDTLNEEASLNSPTHLTCIVRLSTVPKYKYLYKWKVNHRGKGSAAYSGCKIDPAPVLHCDYLKNKDSQTSGYRDESINLFEPLNRKKRSWDEYVIRVNSRTKISETIDKNAEEKNCESVGIGTNNVLKKADYADTDMCMYNDIQNTMYCENIFKTIKSEVDNNENENINYNADDLNENHNDYIIGQAVKCEVEDIKIEEVDIKKEGIIEETQNLIEATDLYVNLPGTSFSILETNTIPKFKESQLGERQSTSIGEIKNWPSTTVNQMHSQGYGANLMQQISLKQALKPVNFQQQPQVLETKPRHLEGSKQALNPTVDPIANKCLCGEPGNWFECMLECQHCKRWFHEKCVGCLQYKLICGDRFYLYVCELCNNGKEFLHRLPIDWDRIVHLSLWNLSHSNIKFGKYGKYFEYALIASWVNNHWELLQCPQHLQTIFLKERTDHILSALNANYRKFKCGREVRKKNSLWKLDVLGPPSVPEIILPPERPFTSAMLHHIRYSERKTELMPIPKTFKVWAVNPQWEALLESLMEQYNQNNK